MLAIKVPRSAILSMLLPVSLLGVVAVFVQAAPADAVSDTTNKTASKIPVVFFILSKYLFSFTFRPPPLNFSLNLVDLVILAFLDGEYFYK